MPEWIPKPKIPEDLAVEALKAKYAIPRPGAPTNIQLVAQALMSGLSSYMTTREQRRQRELEELQDPTITITPELKSSLPKEAQELFTEGQRVKLSSLMPVLKAKPTEPTITVTEEMVKIIPELAPFLNQTILQKSFLDVLKTKITEETREKIAEKGLKFKTEKIKQDIQKAKDDKNKEEAIRTYRELAKSALTSVPSKKDLFDYYVTQIGTLLGYSMLPPEDKSPEAEKQRQTIWEAIFGPKETKEQAETKKKTSTPSKKEKTSDLSKYGIEVE